MIDAPRSPTYAPYRLADVPRLAAVVLAYVVLDRFSRAFLPFNLAGSAVWLLSGLALAVVLMGGRKYWPAVFVGVTIGTGGATQSLSMALTNAVGMTLSVLVAEWLLRAGPLRHFDATITRAGDYLSMVAAGAVGSTINALFGVGLRVLGPHESLSTYADLLMRWWTGDVLGIVLVVPVLLVWHQPPRHWRARRPALEAILGFSVAWLVGQHAFLGWGAHLLGIPSVSYLGFAVVVLGALRFGRHGALLMSSMLAGQALLGHARGVGYFGDRPVWQVWLYLMILSVTGFMVALTLHMRANAERLQAALRELAEAARDAQDLPALFGRLHRIIGELVPATNLYVALYDERHDVMTFPYFVDERDPAPSPRPLGSGLTAEVIRTGKSLLLGPDVLLARKASGQPIIGSSPRSWLGVPLVSRERVIGAVAVQAYAGTVRYSENDRALLEFVADQAAAAIAHKRADAELRTTSQLLDASQAIARLGGWERDLATDTLFWTAETYRLFDTRPEDFDPNTDFSLEFHLPASRRLMAEALLAAAERGEGFDLEVAMLTTTGRRIDVRSTCVATLADGRPVKLTGVFQDITHERAQRERLTLFSDVVRGSPAAIMITDVEGSIEYVNPAFEAISGYTAAEVLGQNPRLLKSGRTTTEEYRTMWTTLLAGGTWRGVFENRAKDGARYWESAVLSGVADSTGAVTHLVGIKENITHVREVEEQLRESQKLEALGTLAGGIAHEFNNTLAVIIGNGELLLEDEPLGTESRDGLNDMLRAARRARDLAQQVLIFSRRRSAPERRPVDLVESVREALRLLGATLPAAVRLEAELPAEPVVVRGDATQLHQLLVNLCTNAWHAVGERGVVTARVTTVRPTGATAVALGLAPGPSYACLSVVDDGVGMTEEVRRRIFEPFFTTKDVGQGTGLGLAVVHGIVAEHGGAIAVDSAPGRGARFDVYLPLSAEAAVASPAARALVRGAGQRIMLVEDEPSLRGVLQRAMTKMGYVVREFADPVKALEAALAAPDEVDLVLTDQSMPAMSGLELSRRLLAVRGDLPILLYSGDVSRATEEAQQLGIREVLEKPLSLTDLGAALARALG